MGVDRHVVLGVARARSPWFADAGRWATTGMVAMDFVKTVSAEQARARLQSGRPFSAVVVDGSLPGLDRELFGAAAEIGATVVVVDDGRRDWDALGAVAVLPTSVSAGDFAAVLDLHATPVHGLDRVPGAVPDAPPTPANGFRARVVAVTGPGGAGASTIAAAVAQGLASDVAHAGTTLLADLALDADQGVLHDAGDVIPGLLEVVERHRTGDPGPDALRAATFDIVDRRYRLLLGLRRHRDWTALRPRALTATLDSLRRAFTMVVADIDPDFEGEAETGSIDVEDRNRMARAALAAADVVVVVAAPGVAGVHGLVRVVGRCLEAGCPPAAVVPVVNRAPRRGPARAEVVAAATEFLTAIAPDASIVSPTLVTDRPEVARAVHDGGPLPPAIVDPVTIAVRRRLEVAGERRRETPTADVAVPVTAGSLGDWFDDEATP